MSALHGKHTDAPHSLVSSDRRRLFRRRCSELFSSTDNKRSGTTVPSTALMSPSCRACVHDSQTHARSSSAACCSFGDADRLRLASVCTYISGGARTHLLCTTASAASFPYFFFFFRSQKSIHKRKHAHKDSLPHPWSLPLLHFLMLEFRRGGQPNALDASGFRPVWIYFV